MLRTILAVITGYVAMVAAVILLNLGTLLTLGVDGAFKPGSYEPATITIIIGIVNGALAALLGGFLCRKVAGHPGPVAALLVVIAVMAVVDIAGVFLITRSAQVEDPGARPENATLVEVMPKARKPMPLVFAMPVIGIFGAALGGGLLLHRHQNPAPDAP